MRVLIVALLISFVLPVSAEANGFLHVGEARLSTKKLGVSLSTRLHATTYAVEGCSRTNAHRVRCTLAFYGTPSSVPQVCRYTSYVTKRHDGTIVTKARDQVCVETP